MGLPGPGDITAAADESTLQGYLEDWLAVTKEQLGGSAETELTIAGGAVTLTGPIHQIDTEADAASDDLDNALVTGVEDGHFVLLMLENIARVVTLQHEAGGAGQMSFIYGQDVVLNSLRQGVLFYVDKSASPDTLREVWRFGFDAPSVVEVNTAGSGAPNLLTADESGKVFSNEGSGAKNYHTLPEARAGLVFTFIVQDADGIRIVAAAGDTIRHAATVSGPAGFAEATTIGNVITLRAINGTEWIAESVIGSWTVT